MCQLPLPRHPRQQLQVGAHASFYLMYRLHRARSSSLQQGGIFLSLSCVTSVTVTLALVTLAAATAGGVLSQRWRWRLLSAAVLPDYSRRDRLLAPAQALQLRVRCMALHSETRLSNNS